MAILDGLKHGYSTYFMYQPSQGLNPQLMQMAMRSKQPAVPSAKSGGSGSGTKKSEFPDGLEAGLKDYAGQRFELEQAKEALTQKLTTAFMNSDFQNIEELPEYQQYVKAVPQIQAEQYRLDINEKLLVNAKGQYGNIISQMDKGNIGTNTAVINYGISRDASGNRVATGAGGTGLGAVGYARDAEGQKQIVNAFVMNDKGETVMNPKLEGFMSNYEFMDWQAANLGYGANGFQRTLESPVLYTAGNAHGRLFQEMQASAGKSIESIRSFFSGEGFDQRVLLESTTTNYENIKENIKTAVQNLTDQQFQAEIVSEYAKAIESGQSLHIPNPKPIKRDGVTYQTGQIMIPVKVEDMSLEDYLTSKVVGLSDVLSESKSITDAPGQGPVTEKMALNQRQISADPAIITSEGHGEIRNIQMTGGASERNGIADNYVTVPMYFLDNGAGYAAYQTKVLRGTYDASPSKVADLRPAATLNSTRDAMTPWGTMEDMESMGAFIWYSTGVTALAPKATVQPNGRRTNEFDFERDVNGNPRVLEMREYDEGSFRNMAEHPTAKTTKKSYNFNNDVWEEVVMVVPGSKLADLKVPIHTDDSKLPKGTWEWRRFDKGKVALEKYAGNIWRVTDDLGVPGKDPAGNIKEGDGDWYAVKMMVPIPTQDLYEYGNNMSQNNYRMYMGQYTTSTLRNREALSNVNTRALLQRENQRQNQNNALAREINR